MNPINLNRIFFPTFTKNKTQPFSHRHTLLPSVDHRSKHNPPLTIPSRSSLLLPTVHRGILLSRTIGLLSPSIAMDRSIEK